MLFSIPSLTRPTTKIHTNNNIHSKSLTRAFRSWIEKYPHQFNQKGMHFCQKWKLHSLLAISLLAQNTSERFCWARFLET